MLSIGQKCYPQEYAAPKASLHHIIDLLKDNRVIELSTLVRYPLRRSIPIPNIEAPSQFILYYPVLFDSIFKKRLTESDLSDLFQNHGDYGILNGDLWINAEGMIISVNHSSKQERELKTLLESEIASHTYSGLRTSNEIVLMWSTEKYEIRVDKTSEGLRYASWSKSNAFSGKPDLIINGRKERFHGTKGGIAYTFENGGWRYILDQVEICADTQYCGRFLKVWHGDTLKLNSTCEEQIYPAQREDYGRIADMIRGDQIVSLSSVIRYPLEWASDPMPTIRNANDFILSYMLQVDSLFKQKLASYHNLEIYHKYGYNMGDLWLDETDSLVAINYATPQYGSLNTWLKNEIQNALYSDMKDSKEYDMTLQSEKFLIRVDWMGIEKGFRYTAWPRGSAISEKPALIIYHGEAEYHGNMGSKTVTFKNGPWTYIIDYWVHEYLTPTLIVLYNSVEKINTKIQRIKQSDCKMNTVKAGK